MNGSDDSLVINGMTARWDWKNKWKIVAPNGRTVHRCDHLAEAVAWMTEHPVHLAQRERQPHDTATRSRRWRERRRMEKELAENRHARMVQDRGRRTRVT